MAARLSVYFTRWQPPGTPPNLYQSVVNDASWGSVVWRGVDVCGVGRFSRRFAGGLSLVGGEFFSQGQAGLWPVALGATNCVLPSRMPGVVVLPGQVHGPSGRDADSNSD